eukprot:GHVU01168823.1.p1 GENE.GHVU01168823.1~~GHVU01168823.1.p1  ORF type:complete len:310 (-),score=46.88 GHVU01168823.1:333-1262(-)
MCSWMCLWVCMQQGQQQHLDPWRLVRLWESSFFLSSFQNLEATEQSFFYVVSLSPVNPRLKYERRCIPPVTLYTPGFILAPGEHRVLNVPIGVWPRTTFQLSYSQLADFHIIIQHWKFKTAAFNELFAEYKMSLKDVVESEPEQRILLKRKLQNTNDRSYEVHNMRITLHLSEVFEFDLYFDSWWFIPEAKMPKKLQALPKKFKLCLPRGRGMGETVAWTELSNNHYWKCPARVTFTGTKSNLENSCFILIVGRDPTFPVLPRDRAGRARPRRARRSSLLRSHHEQQQQQQRRPEQQQQRQQPSGLLLR